MSDLERTRSYVTFTELGGCKVTEEQVIAELRRMPLDGVLGYLGKISLEAIRKENFYCPTIQGNYLNLAIVDDFPKPLPRAADMYIPGRVPATNDRHTFIHQRNLTWLAHHAIIACDQTSSITQFSYSFMTRCCRLLLIVNDFFYDPKIDPRQSLVVAKEFALDMLRIQPFIEFTATSEAALLEIGRQWLIYSRFLTRHIDIEALFSEKIGFTLDEYFDVLFAVVVHFTGRLSQEGNPWQKLDSLFEELEDGRDLAEKFFCRWAVTPEEYKVSVSGCRQKANFAPHFDYVHLQESPVIKARKSGVLVPVLPYLWEKAVNEPYFKLAEGDNIFRTKYGDAFEDYAHSVVKKIKNSANGGIWRIHRSPESTKGHELTDTLLTFNSYAIMFEHKGGRTHSVFLRGGCGDRVVGPPDEILERLQNGCPVDLKELRESDKALLTRGIWQMATATEDLMQWINIETGEIIRKIFPIVVYQGPLKVNAITRLAYLSSLMESIKALISQEWQPIQWIHISDLEYLAEIAEQSEGDLDLLDLLSEKVRRFPDESFEGFLSDRYGELEIKGDLASICREFPARVINRFWPNAREGAARTVP